MKTCVADCAGFLLCKSLCTLPFPYLTKQKCCDKFNTNEAISLHEFSRVKRLPLERETGAKDKRGTQEGKMKKIVCFLMALTVMLALAGTAFAADVSASYSNGMLTVSTGSNGWFRISVDGSGTGRSLTPSVPTLTWEYPLTNGEHRISISSDIHGSGSTTITVTDGIAKPEQGSNNNQNPPKATQPPQVPEHTEHIPADIAAVEPTCTRTGLTVGQKCAVGGEILKEQEVVPALGHRYTIASRTDNSLSLQCIRCDKKLKVGVKEAVENRYGNIILNEKGEAVTYNALPNKTDGKLMTLTLARKAEQATLILENSLIMQLIREGYDRVELVNGKTTDAVIELYQISTSWFSTNEPIASYLFTFASEGQVTVEALAGANRVTANSYTGVTVK